MVRKPLAVAAVAATLASAAFSTQAQAGGEPILGALLGGGIGAAIGHSVNGHNGAIVGGALGAIAGAAIAANSGDYYDGGYYAAPGAYYPGPAPYAPYYGGATVYYEPAVRYYGHRAVVDHGRHSVHDQGHRY